MFTWVSIKLQYIYTWILIVCVHYNSTHSSTTIQKQGRENKRMCVCERFLMHPALRFPFLPSKHELHARYTASFTIMIWPRVAAILTGCVPLFSRAQNVFSIQRSQSRNPAIVSRRASSLNVLERERSEKKHVLHSSARHTACSARLARACASLTHKQTTSSPIFPPQVRSWFPLRYRTRQQAVCRSCDQYHLERSIQVFVPTTERVMNDKTIVFWPRLTPYSPLTLT